MTEYCEWSAGHSACGDPDDGGQPCTNISACDVCGCCAECGPHWGCCACPDRGDDPHRTMQHIDCTAAAGSTIPTTTRAGNSDQGNR
jgi:hypothetical protein